MAQAGPSLLAQPSHPVKPKSPDFNRKLRRGSSNLMPNQYLCETEFDDLSPDDSIIDHAFLSEDNFMLIVLLTSNGQLCTFHKSGQEALQQCTIKLRSLLGGIVDPLAICLSPDASFLVIACIDCTLHVIPIKSVLNTNWGGDKSLMLKFGPFRVPVGTSSIDVDVKLVPASIKCVVSLALKRYIAVLATRGGVIFIVDLDSRKCMAEMTSPQSIHDIEIVKTNYRIDLLFTSFLGTQWVIPFESNGRSFKEVLASIIPSELRQLAPADSVCSLTGKRISVLDRKQSTLELYSSLEAVGLSPLSKYRVPPDTVMTWSSTKVLFAVSPKNGDSGISELRCAIHFGLTDVRLEYTLVRGSPEWRYLAFVPLASQRRQLPSCYLITERGLVSLRQNPSCQIEDIVAEFLFRLQDFSSDSLAKACSAADLEINSFKKSLIPRVLSTRTKKLAASDVARILLMAKVVELKMETLVELFAKNEQEHCLLNEVLRVVEADKRNPVKCKVVELFAKKCLAGKEREDYACYRQKKDGELSAFLSRHSDIIGGIESVLLVPLWKSAHILGSRTDQATQSVLHHLIKHGKEEFAQGDGTVRSQLLSCASQLKWTCLKPAEAAELIEVLSSWVVQYPSISLSENCLRLANQYAQKFPEPCVILYCAAAVYLLSEDGDRHNHAVAKPVSLSCGLNLSAAITYDDRLLFWGSFSTEQSNAKRTVEPSARRNSSAVSSPVQSPRKEAAKTLPQSVHMGSRPLAVACGTEHILVLTHSGELFSWGNNRFGQCGGGNNVPVTEPQLLEGKWPPISQLAAGQFHSAFLCEDGSLWTWGWGLFGQLGHGQRSISDYFAPKRVEGLRKKMKSVSCGRVHTILLTEDGQILVAGSASYGQSGSNDDLKKFHSFTPLLVEEEGLKFVMASTRFYHSVAVTEDGRVFEWGRNPQEMKMKMFLMRRLKNSKEGKSGGEGGDSVAQNHKLPAEVPRDDLGIREVHHLLDGKVMALSTGLSHSAAITDQGSLFTWGKALEYQLGHGNKSERSEPHQVFEPAGLTWKFVECGGNHTLAATSDGRIFSWGRNDFTQCGMPSEKSNSSTPKRIYYGKEGQRKCVQLNDDSSFVAKPSLLSDIQLKIPMTDDPVRELDENMLMKHLNSSSWEVLERLASLFLNKSLGPSLDNSVHLALCYLMAGNVDEAISQAGRAAQHFGPTPEVTAMASLAWEIIANHEDVQKKEILTRAFKCLPLTQTQRNSSQLRSLWPNVWEDSDCQRKLMAKEKIAVLENWMVDVKPLSSCSLPGASLRTGSPRIRVFAQCGHTESAALGMAGECSTCAEEWKDKVRLTLGSD